MKQGNHFLFMFFFTFCWSSFSTKTFINNPSRFNLFSTTNQTKIQISKDVETYYYDQTIDHFSYTPLSYTKFKQRYFVNFKYWGGANCSAPILVFLGGESSVDGISDGFMTDNAATFKALMVYMEHRYYGESMPFGSIEEAYKNTSTLCYLNSAQALADYAQVVIHLKETFHAQKSPVIVMGGSYGGMLAAWFRLKYPHITIGALASSAPLLYFDNITPQNAYYDVVSRDFKEASKTCYKIIQKSWSVIDKVASQPNGLSILSQRFNTCYPLEKSDELKEYLQLNYVYTAQYQNPSVMFICEAIERSYFGSDILSQIYGGVVALAGYGKCHVNFNKYDNNAPKYFGWDWQVCTEMLMPIGIGKGTMFQPNPFNLKNFVENCYKKFGYSNLRRPHWITTYYGGHNITLVLQKFASNIIFSNGLKDPYSSAGVLNDISTSLVALHTVNGSHVLDILGADKSDPKWLVDQRKKEVKIMKRWIAEYYAAELADYVC